MALDLSDSGKHVRTRDGREVKILMTDGGGSYPIIGAMKILSGSGWAMERWDSDGRAIIGVSDPRDLIPYAPTEQWLIDVPAGQTPIVFVPTGEVRPPKTGESYFPLNEREVYTATCDCVRDCKILTPVQPVKVER